MLQQQQHHSKVQPIQAHFALLVLLFSPILAQQIIIDQLNSSISSDTGRLHFQKMSLDPSHINGLAVFGWVKVPSDFSELDSGKIVEAISVDFPQYSSGIINTIDDYLFSVSVNTWKGENQFYFFCDLNGEEFLNMIQISSDNLGSWIFMYVGHSFLENKQTYFTIQGAASIQSKVTQATQKQLKTYYQISAGTGKYLKKQFFIGEMERLTIMAGDDAYRETNFQELHSLHPSFQYPCPVLFKKCGYIGDYVVSCHTTNYERIKSIRMRNQGETVNVCVDDNIGKMVQVKQTVECIKQEILKTLVENEIIKELESELNSLCAKAEGDQQN